MNQTHTLLLLLLLLPAVFAVYAYGVYPAWLRLRRPGAIAAKTFGVDALPMITVTLPVYNEERRLAAALDALLASDYPRDRLHVLVISDASEDRTDDIARSYADRGVELMRQPQRQGKTAAENASRAAVRGEIVVNTDASVRVAPGTLSALIRVFADPTIGVASGFDVSVSSDPSERVEGESRYVGYEMRVREMENMWYGIVGASGCLFAIRRELHAEYLPDFLSRDFASALVAREHGFRAVSVADAIVYVPRAGTLATEYRRKVRTMARGLRTLWFKRHLLNPVKYGFFAVALWSHKMARWLVYPAVVVASITALVLATGWGLFWPATLTLLASVALGRYAMGSVDKSVGGRFMRLLAFGFAANLAGVMAWWEFLRGARMAVWEPTRRPG